MLKQRRTSSHRKYSLLKSLSIDVLAMRPCSHCTRSIKACKIVDESNKCLECVRLSYVCDLAPLDTNRYRRLEEQRKRLKVEFHATIARQQAKVVKQQRLIQQLKFVENEQQTMIDAKLQNIEELNQEERAPLSLELTIDVFSKQIALSNAFDDWSLTSFDFLETSSTSSSNSWDALSILTYSSW